MKLSAPAARRALALLTLAAAPAAWAAEPALVEACLPPACAVPVALHWPGAFGDSAIEKAAMALSLACAWLTVWGLFLLLGISPRRRHPLGMLVGSEARAHWAKQEDERSAAWRAMKANPEKLLATRMTGAAMLLAGALVAKGALMMDPSAPEDLSGAVASVQSWDASGPKPLYALRLDPQGAACEIKAGSCVPWGKWTARTDALVLIPELGSRRPVLRLLPDESRARYWAKPERGDKLSLMARVERRRAPEEAPDGFTANRTRKLD